MTILALIGLTGCGGPATTPTAAPPTAPAAPITLRIACPSGAPAALLASYGESAARRVGARLQVVTPDAAGGPGSSAEYDVLVLRPADLPREAAAGRLQPVPDSYTARTGPYRWGELLPVYSDRLLLWRGRPYALPLLGESPLCFYRADLLASPRHREAFRKAHGRDLAPPATWQDFADIAEYFYRHREPSGPSPSLPPLADDEARDTAFHTVAASLAVRAVRAADRREHTDAQLFSFDYDLATGEPRIARPGFVAALRLLQRLQPFRAAVDGRPAPQAFADGRAVLALADASWIERFQKAKQPFGVCRIPGSVEVYDAATGQAHAVTGGNYVPYQGVGSWLAAVPAGSAQAETAFAFLADLTGEEVSSQVVLDRRLGGGATRQRHFDARGWSVFDLDQAQTDALVSALRQTVQHPGLSNPTSCLRLPDAAEHRGSLRAELKAALDAKKDASAALQAVAARWREIDARKPRGQARVDYALSLGLPAPE